MGSGSGTQLGAGVVRLTTVGDGVGSGSGTQLGCADGAVGNIVGADDFHDRLFQPGLGHIISVSFCSQSTQYVTNLSLRKKIGHE